MIPEEKKEQIQLEEIFRNEIRKKIESEEKSAVWSFLNSAFVVWFLSTIVIGFLSLGYKQLKESQSEDNRRIQALEVVLEEGQFRMAQLDRAMADVSLTRALVLKELLGNKKVVSGELIHKFLQKTALLAVTIQLGGVTDIPPLGEDRRVNIGNSGYAPRNLPYAQGYKYPEYKFLSLHDLVRRAHKLKAGESISTEESDNIKVALDELSYRADASVLEHIFQDWFQRTQASGQYKERYGSAYKVYKINFSDYEEELMEISGWIGRIKDHLDDDIRYRKGIVDFESY